MDAISATSSSLPQSGTADDIQITVLKKAMDIQAQSAAQLVQAATQAAPSNNPPHLGKSVNTFA